MVDNKDKRRNATLRVLVRLVFIVDVGCMQVTYLILRLLSFQSDYKAILYHFLIFNFISAFNILGFCGMLPLDFFEYHCDFLLINLLAQIISSITTWGFMLYAIIPAYSMVFITQHVGKHLEVPTKDSATTRTRYKRRRKIQFIPEDESGRQEDIK